MTEKSEAIALLNDGFRRTMAGGKVVLTSGVFCLPAADREEIMMVVRSFEAFEPDDDPYGEHDFGAVEIKGRQILWKIDYYGADTNSGSEDPADPTLTTRVLTIMLADEY